jgi:uncharacterized protein YciI
MATTQSTVDRMRKDFVGKKLYLVFLRPTETADSRDAVREHHLTFVRELEQSGRLFMAGPFIDDRTDTPTGSGLFILRGDSSDEIDNIMQKNTYFTNDFRTCEIQPWRLNEGFIAVNLNFSDQSLTLN